MAEPVWPRLEAIWTWPTAPPPHLIQRLVATTGDRGNDQRCRRRRERDPPGKQRADEPRRRRKAAGPLLSRCTKLGDLENMDRFVALNGRQSKRIALN